MPKQKTRKSVTKRFKITKNGKIMRRHNFTRHLRVTKSKSKNRQQQKQVEVTGYFGKMLRKYLGLVPRKARTEDGKN